MRLINTLITFLLIAIIAGCSSTQNPDPKAAQASASHVVKQATANHPLLYQNQEAGLKIDQTAAWTKATENMSASKLNVVFKTKDLDAIVSVLSPKKSIKSIQSDLLKSVSHPAVLSQTNSRLDFQAGTKDKIRVLNYLKKNNNHTYIFSFITPLKSFNQEKPVIQKFMASVQIN